VRPSPNARGLSAITRYGVKSFGDLFTARQSLSLLTLIRLSKQTNDKHSAHVQDLLALAVSKLAERLNVLCDWMVGVECSGHVFSHHDLPAGWDFAEAVSTAESSGSYDSALDVICNTIEKIGCDWRVGQLDQADACKSPLANESVNVWFTDPPYYDSIPYADLSDFFFVWLKRSLPDLPLLKARLDPATGLTPKSEECVWNQSHLVNGHAKDGAFFERTITKAFGEGKRILRQDGIGCVVFAHKTTDGWEALLTALRTGGWVVTASWPITTERQSRQNARDTASLSGSVHLVCRPRDPNAGVGDWSEVKAAMEKRIREWLPTLTKHGVRGADAIFSCLGPALESYSRYEKVLTQADREVPLGGDPEASEPQDRGFLAYVFETLSKEALKQVLGDAQTEGYEEDARLTALFLWTLQTTKANGKKAAEVTGDGEYEGDEEKPAKAVGGLSMPFDTFIRLTRPMGIHYPDLQGRIIEIDKGIVQLLPVHERMEQLLGERANRKDAEFNIQDFRQGELFSKQATKSDAPKLASKTQAQSGNQKDPNALTTLDRIHRSMLLFSLGRSTLLRQVLEDEMQKNKRFERLALSLNALYPEGSDERRMLEGVQAAMRGVK